MKPVNLLVLAQGFESVPAPLLPAFEAQLSVRDRRVVERLVSFCLEEPV